MLLETSQASGSRTEILESMRVKLFMQGKSLYYKSHLDALERGEHDLRRVAPVQL